MENLTAFDINILKTIATVVMVLFIKLILPFFKYHVKLSAFYKSREVAIRLGGTTDLKRVRAFSKFMSLDKIDFEKSDLDSSVFKDLFSSFKK